MMSIDRLAGTDRLRHAIDSGTTEKLLRQWARDETHVRQIREPYLLYR